MQIARRPLDIKCDYINMLLDVASERVRYRGSRVYELELGVSTHQLRLLRLVGRQPGISMGEVAQRSGIEKTLVSKLVSALAQRGLVERHVGTDDARRILLSLTDAGEALVLRAEPIGHKLEAGYQGVLSPAEIATLRGLLRKLIDGESRTREAFDSFVARLRDSKVDAARPSSSNDR